MSLALVVVGLVQEPSLNLPEVIGDCSVHSVLSCEEAWFPELDVRLLVFTAVAPYSHTFKTNKDVFYFLSEFKKLHPSCEFWLCTEQDIEPGDVCLNAPEVSSVLRISKLVQMLEEWVCLGSQFSEI
jgi:hypothetical protein